MMKECGLHASSLVEEVGQHPAWRGDLSPKEVERLLSQQEPFTFVLSGSGDPFYLLSYIKSDACSIVHVLFKKVVIEMPQQKRGYCNGSNLIFSSLEAFIRFKIKGRGLLPGSAKSGERQELKRPA